MTTASIPDVLYHATWPSRVESIQQEGLRSAWEGVYFCAKPHHAAGFLRMRGGEMIGIKKIFHAGQMHDVPDIVLHDNIVVFDVDTSGLDPALFSKSEDHVMGFGFYPADLESWVYAGHVPPEAIVGLSNHSRLVDR